MPLLINKGFEKSFNHLAILLRKIPYHGQAILDSEMISGGVFGGLSSELPMMEFFILMDLTKLEIVQAIAKRCRKSNAPLIGSTTKSTETPSIMKRPSDKNIIQYEF